MRLDILLHHDVQVDFVDGGSMIGFVDAYMSADDNFPDSESIVLLCKKIHYEISRDEIKKVTILDR